MSHRRIFIVLTCFISFVLVSVAAHAQTGRARLISAANVTVRQSPSPNAPAMAQLPLGTEVREGGDTDLEKTWLRIDLPDGKSGWVFARFTRPLDPVWKWQTYEAVITERLTRQGDGFSAAAELVVFIERIGKDVSDPEARARVDLQWLRAVHHALLTIPVRQKDREPFASWLARYKDWAVYDEIGGRLKLAHGAVWKVHGARTGSSTADDIAWLAVTVGLIGECEGDVTCYLEWRNRLQGEYLRKHPTGAHAPEAVAAIGDLAMNVNAQPSWLDFTPSRDCAPLKTSADALHDAVSHAASSAAREPTLVALASIRRRCQ